MFVSEKALVNCFLQQARDDSSPWGQIKVRLEFFYSRGRTDVVAVSEDGKVLAFEAKLTKWRVALRQAYRNKCFADRSYVVLPESSGISASRFEAEFARLGVGLCFVSENDLMIVHDAPNSTPLQPWLRERAVSFACAMED